VTTVASGQRAEVAAADYLKKLGYKIVHRNWRTRFCEIDIVAQKGKTIYFVEVKYRIRDTQGGGLDFITPTKLRQMHFAADIWAQKYNWSGDSQLSAIEVSGDDFIITEYLPDLS